MFFASSKNKLHFIIDYIFDEFFYKRDDHTHILKSYISIFRKYIYDQDLNDLTYIKVLNLHLSDKIDIRFKNQISNLRYFLFIFENVRKCD